MFGVQNPAGQDSKTVCVICVWTRVFERITRILRIDFTNDLANLAYSKTGVKCKSPLPHHIQSTHARPSGRKAVGAF